MKANCILLRKMSALLAIRSTNWDDVEVQSKARSAADFFTNN